MGSGSTDTCSTMGGGPSKAQDATDKGKSEKQRIPVVEEAFVQKIAYKCGVTEEELEKKKEVYLDHLSGDPTLKFQVSFKNSVKKAPINTQTISLKNLALKNILNVGI